MNEEGAWSWLLPTAVGALRAEWRSGAVWWARWGGSPVGPARGGGGALFVVGPAGLGKTTVLEHAITAARSRFVVGVGRGDQVEAVLPFGLIGQALDQLLKRKLLGGSMAL